MVADRLYRIKLGFCHIERIVKRKDVFRQLDWTRNSKVFKKSQLHLLDCLTDQSSKGAKRGTCNLKGEVVVVPTSSLMTA